MRCTLLILLSVSFGSTNVPAQPVAVLSPGAEVAGVGQPEWSRRWWQWAFSFDDSNSPVADRTGARCGLGQAGPVWFLAGTYGTRRTERICRVPAGKIIFLPLINYLAYPDPGRPENCLSLMSRASRLVQSPTALVLELNGQRIEGLLAHRQASQGCFALPGTSITLAAADGYYIAIDQLPVGKHTLNFGGILPTMSQAVTYELVVE